MFDTPGVHTMEEVTASFGQKDGRGKTVWFSTCDVLKIAVYVYGNANVFGGRFQVLFLQRYLRMSI